MKIALNKFVSWLENKNLKPRTVEQYVYYFNKFTFEDFNQESVAKFLMDKANRNSVARSFLVNLQKYIKVNYEELGLTELQRMKAAEVELPRLTGRTKVRLVNPLKPEDIELLVKFMETEKDIIQLYLNYYCALRVGELVKISIMSFNWEEWKKDTSKMGECRVFGKGDKEGIALVPPWLMVRMARYIRSGTFDSVNSKLFTKDTEEMIVKNRTRAWERKLREAGIKSGLTRLENGKVIGGTSVYPHRLRHSYASYLINVKNMDIRKVQEILRHSDIQSTQIYTQIDKEALKEELNK